jgi:hypothetical protein
LKKYNNYSLRKEGRSVSEYRDFLRRMNVRDDLREDLQLLNHYIETIGKSYGADLRHFKAENNAERLPPPYHFVQGDYGVRLYCIRVSDEIVILLNGDHKTSQKVQDCPNCFPHFKFANKVAEAFWSAVESGIIEYEGKEIFFNLDDYELEID